MSNPGQWLIDLDNPDNGAVPDGLVPVEGYRKEGRPPEEVAIMEKAEYYGASAVFFEAERNGKPPLAQAFVFVSDGSDRDPIREKTFAKLHQRLWSWGGVPLVYRKTSGLVQLFRCAHKADFESKGKVVFKPYKTLKLAGQIAIDPWWDARRLRNGTLWDDPKICKELLSAKEAAQKTLIDEVKRLHKDLNKQENTEGKAREKAKEKEDVLPQPLRRKLLILSLLVAYLEARKVFEAGYFSRFRAEAERFFQVLADGPALVRLLDDLDTRFNGHAFHLSQEDRAVLQDGKQARPLARFASLVEGRQEPSGQLTLWQRYSFADLPIELISHIYQLFVGDKKTAVYTPPFLVRLMLGEALNWERLDRLEAENEIILDPACGSGVFLVEAYKRLVLHWRSRNGWARPDVLVLKKLLTRVHGIDLEDSAVELAAFSLYLALCDALEPETIRASIKLFPELRGKTLHAGCFFAACETHRVKEKIGVVVGNPPFLSSLNTPGAKRSYKRYQDQHGALPDKQLAYLFLHESMAALARGGVSALLQPQGFFYNQGALDFRRRFMERWDVREILDFISVRGLFQKGGADTKVVMIVAEAGESPPDRQILHATFRRSGSADAEQGFDIDYYDMHWLPRKLALTNDGVWRTDLLGGGRVLGFVDRLKEYRTLGQYADKKGWEHGEGYIVGKSGKHKTAKHITGHPTLPSEAITANGIDEHLIDVEQAELFASARDRKQFRSPMLLVREQMDIPFGLWTNGYLTYKDQVVGFCAPESDLTKLKQVARWLSEQRVPLQAFLAATSTRLFNRKATAVSSFDISSLPYPENADLELTNHEQILVDDIVDYYRDLIRLGEDSAAMRESGVAALPQFNDTYSRQINAIYKKKPLRALEARRWPGIICQPFVFGEGEVDWEGADELQGRIDKLLREEKNSTLAITRIARIYDGHCIYLLKPDRLRYWLRSVALRDADETLADLWSQGF
uniref:N-6 DNA Methylase n=1 Tax=Candidatus Kentrum sp. MB TaxID=2138164 RepID=A0A451BFA2_9GAMM|nr:MAG: N-6 DNA Methylase [Candidatus Kentron sp. MB]VFK34710.1 MAG: N-6 DNA Methylase [Candidatus Kentron sp. MB]VFK76959.1 MAG: N-6 DNA Methylase [Candidatus Kentron sp. MB]